MILTADIVRQHYPSLVSASDEATWSELLPRVESACRHYLGWQRADGGDVGFALATRTHYASGASELDDQAIRLPIGDLAGVTSIHHAPDWQYATGTVIDLSGVVVDGTVLHRRDGWPTDRRGLRIVYTAGYESADTAPPALLMGLAVAARHVWLMRTGGGVQSGSMAGQSFSTPGRSYLWPSEVREALAASGVAHYGDQLG